MTKDACTCGNDIGPGQPTNDGSDGTYEIDESWVLVEELPHASKTSPPTRTSHVDRTGCVSPASFPKPPEISTSLHPEYRSTSCVDENNTKQLFASRKLWDAERLRYWECCELVEHNLQRLTGCVEDHVAASASQQVEVLRQQLATHFSILEAQHQDLERAEKEMQRLEQVWSIDNESGTETGREVRPGRASIGLYQKEPPIIENYMRRAGDASIAAERLAELDYEISTRSSSSCGFRGVELVLDVQRRAILNAELRSATRDAEALKAACLERGLDPERSRYR
jgi:hypothetical protein